VPRPIRIRPVEPADFAQWEPLWAGYNSFYERALPDGITRTSWARFLDAGEPVHAAVAEQDGGLIGLVHYLYHRSTTTIEPTCYLQDLFTDPEARGAGVGRALIDHVYRAASTAGCSRVYWQTHHSNAPAIRLYEKMAERSGFVRYVKELTPSPP
jgi:GNAT superfamily N-acetyltransferase